MRNEYPIPSLYVNCIGYFEFEFKGTKFYIQEGMLSQKGKATGFSSEDNEIVYFIDREMPNQKLRDGLEFAKKHYLNEDLSIKLPFKVKVANDIISAMDDVKSKRIKI